MQRVVKGGGEVSKKCASQRGRSGEFEHGFPPFAPAPPPTLNNVPSISEKINRTIIGWSC